MNNNTNAQQTQRMLIYREELVERIAQLCHDDGQLELLEGVHLIRASMPVGLIHGVFKPSFCVIAQGSKEIQLGDSRYRYDPFHYLITTIELPYVSQILEASKEQPYLGFILGLSPALVSAVMAEAGLDLASDHCKTRAMNVSPLDVDLQDAILRLVRLADAPGEAPLFKPLIMREIIYRLLMGSQGARLRHLAMQGGYSSCIARAVESLRRNFNQPLCIKDLAQELGLSISGFHHHFKSVTAMSPLQFQKQLRLQEARRLMLNEDLDAAGAAYRVGYRDASHFNREYKNLFGLPPIQDIRLLREKNA
ncbi:MAG: AraC family transcriptional regulator [Anaerolineae bacterium]|nr:AraC family transcriptional regulator [Anaerolineae bacterium]